MPGSVDGWPARAPTCGRLTTTRLLNNLYSLPSSDLHDITTGFNGYRAGTGYDLVTGLGTIDAARFVPDLVRLARQEAS